ncbi:MAG: carbon starvation protein A [Phascolarctobacterium sp.]|nr:carbon starvation protein A [Phascolarctobacterium sp.]
MLLTLFVITIVCFSLAYKFYGGFQSRYYGLDPERTTPAKELQDNIDYCPAHPAVLMGHHFASIAGAGPVVGPIAAAALLGWLPTFCWIIVGCIFFGGVHDMGALVASIRHKGLSIGEVVRQWIGERGQKLFLAFTWLSLTLVVAVFLELASQTFAADPAVAFTASLYILMAMVFGVAIYRYGVSLKVSTIIMLPILFGALVFGLDSAWVQSTFSASVDFWRVLLIGYIFAASILPVWLLLQPRDYLASYMLYFSVFIGGVGMIFGGASYEVKLPAFKGFVTANGDYLWPLLFITVACGAISGFHSLVASGTTSKQLTRETDAVPVGYGAMLLEGVVGVIALGTIMMSGDLLKGGPTVVYGHGLGQFATLLGISPRLGTAIGLLALNSFILTSLDTATRLARYQLQEFTGMSLNKYLATGISVGVALALIFYKVGNTLAWQLIWPIFGASNQLVAAIGLMALGVWVIRALKKSAKFIMYPMYFMLTTTIVALVQMLLNPKTNMVVFCFDLVLLVLTMLLLKEAYAALKKKDE